METYPEDTEDSFEELAPLVKDAAVVEEGSRYAGQVAVLGKKMQERLANLKIFMVRERGRAERLAKFLYYSSLSLHRTPDHRFLIIYSFLHFLPLFYMFFIFLVRFTF